MNRLWPFGPRTAVLAAPVIIVSLLAFLALLRYVAGWPGAGADTAVLIGVLVLSLLPLILVMVDLLVERGAVLEYRGVKIDLSRVAAGGGVATLAVPSNIGAPGRAIGDSGSNQILWALAETASHEVVVVDLHEGDAWWETRLLVLVAGAARRGRPSAMVFIGTDGTRPGCFLGWAPPSVLLDRLLASSDVYQHIYAMSEAAENQWTLVEPAPPVPVPPQPTWIDGLAARHFWMAFEAGLPKPLRFEQLLASELSEKVETDHVPRGITTVRLDDLFRPVLHKTAIEETSPASDQLEAMFSDHGAFIAVTREGRYQRLLPRSAAVNAILRDLARANVTKT